MLIPEKHYKALTIEVLRKNFDANETFFIERELTQLRAKIYEVRFPELIARSLMPFATDIAPSANVYSYKVLTPMGAAKFIGNMARDLPRVDNVAREVLGKVHPIGLSYGWDINELREAARLGVPLADTKARTARAAAERAVDEVLAFGDLALSAGQIGLELNGIANNPDVIANGIVAGSFWLDVSPPNPGDILTDMSTLVSRVSTNTNSIFDVDTLILPTAHHNYVSQTPFSALTGESILSVFKKNNPQITLVRPWYRLNTAGATGGPRGIAYKRDPMVLEGVVPQGFEQLPPEQHGLEVVINCTERCGGVKIYQPSAMVYVDFATS